MPLAALQHARVPLNFTVWMSVTLECHGINARYEAALEKRNLKLRGSAADLLAAGMPQSGIAKIVRLTPGDLGFERAVPYREICERALELGLAYCRAETVFALRIKYAKQPLGEVLRMCMEPVRSSNGLCEIPTLEERRDHTVIGCWRAHPDDRYEPAYALAFELP